MAKKAFTARRVQKQEELVYTADTKIKKVLGKPAYKVWRVLMRVHDETGENWMLRRTIASQAGLSNHHTSKCLTKLRTLGLVVPTGWKNRAGDISGRWIWTMTRHVVGYRDEYGRTFLPRSVHEKITAHRGRGRPPKEGGSVVPMRVKSPQKSLVTSTTYAGAEIEPAKKQGATERNKNINSTLSFQERDYHQDGSTLRESQPSPTATASAPSESPQPRLAAGEHFLAGGSGVFDGNPVRISDAEVGADQIIIRKFARKLEVLGLPAFPSWNLAKLPGPSEGPDDVEECAEWLARMYADVVRQYTKGGRRFGWRGSARRQSWWGTVVAATQRLKEAGINPTLWLAWSFRFWGGKGAPSVAWVFSVKRMDKRADWFRQEEDGLLWSGKVVHTPASTEFHRRWKALEDAIFWLGPATEAQLKAACYPILDPVRYKALVSMADFEAREARARLKREVARGKWVWPL